MANEKSTETVVAELSKPRKVRCDHCNKIISLGDVVGFATDSDQRYVPYEDDHYLLCSECIYKNTHLFKVLAFLTFLRGGE